MLVWVIYFIQSHNIIGTYPYCIVYIRIWTWMHVAMYCSVIYKMYSMAYEAWHWSQHMSTMNSWQSTYVVIKSFVA